MHPQIVERDAARYKRVLEMIAADLLKAPQDYYHAALIMQHGDAPADYERAYQFASKAVELKLPEDYGNRARWLACAAKDRWLWSLDKPQIYGTQFKKNAAGQWTIEPFDTQAVTDAERIAAGVLTLEQTQQRLQRMNSEQ
jgi:hypothetical protein